MIFCYIFLRYDRNVYIIDCEQAILHPLHTVVAKLRYLPRFIGSHCPILYATLFFGMTQLFFSRDAGISNSRTIAVNETGDGYHSGARGRYYFK